MMEFEWDEAKAAANLEKHGVAFVDAINVFKDQFANFMQDTRFQYEEVRMLAYGLIDARLHAVVYTLREGKVRIVPARKANDREVKKYGYRQN